MALNLHHIFEKIEQYRSEIQDILVINVSGDTDDELDELLTLFPYATLHLTNSNPESYLVEKLSPTLALNSYPNSDLLILVKIPNTDEYADIPNLFNGRFIISIGNLRFHQLVWPLNRLWNIIIEESKIYMYENCYKDANNGYEIYNSLHEYEMTGRLPLQYRNTNYLDEYAIRTLQKFWQNIPINKILAINSGDGKLETALNKILFSETELYLTDIVAYPPYVEKLSAKDSIVKYADSDLIITVWPDFRATGYKDILKLYNGDYIMFWGNDSCDPEFCFIRELENWGKSVFDLQFESSDDSIVIRKKRLGSESKTDSD